MSDLDRYSRSEAESKSDRRDLRRELYEVKDENAKAHAALHEKIAILETKVDQMVDMLKIGKAGIAFIKWMSAVGAGVAVIWTALVQFGKPH